MPFIIPIRAGPARSPNAIPLFTGGWPGLADQTWPVPDLLSINCKLDRARVSPLQLSFHCECTKLTLVVTYLIKTPTLSYFRSHLLDQNTYFVILHQKHYAHSPLFRALLLLCLQVKVQEGIQNLTRRVEMDTSNHVSSKENKNIGKLGFVLFNFIS
jgi:hypothetical protein